MWARWVRPCGKLPSNSPLPGSTSSVNRPRSLRRGSHGRTRRALARARPGWRGIRRARTNSRGTRPRGPGARRLGGSDTGARRRRRARSRIAAVVRSIRSSRQSTNSTVGSSSSAASRLGTVERLNEHTAGAVVAAPLDRLARSRRGHAASGGPGPGACIHRPAACRGRAPTSTGPSNGRSAPGLRATPRSRSPARPTARPRGRSTTRESASRRRSASAHGDASARSG